MQEQSKLPFITFVDLTKAFDIVCRKSLYKILKNRLSTYPFAVDHFWSRGHECLHSVQWKYIRVFQGVEWRWTGSCPCTHSLYHLLCCTPSTCLWWERRWNSPQNQIRWISFQREKTEVLIRELLFADAAMTATHSEIELQRLVDRLKTEVIGQGTNSPPDI